MLKDNLTNQYNEIFEGLYILKPDIFADDRGFFLESWNKENFNKSINKEINFVQDNHSLSQFGVLRGLHFQLNPFSQGKLVRVIKGEIFDVFVDLRINSKTFKSWGGVNLNSNNKKMIWIPEGFAHGFLSLKDNTEVIYKVNQYWNSSLERTLIWNDKEINIDWPLSEYNIKELIISEKDNNSYSFNQLFKRGEINL